VSPDVLLSGAVGALIVFVLGALREWWREEREGLLQLLTAEIEHNAEVERTVGETTRDLLSEENFRKLSTVTWRELQGRAAALLHDDLFVALNGYYSALQTLLTLLSFEDRASQRTNRVIREAYTELTGKEVPANRNPWDEYLAATRDAQARARDRIVAYLALRWDDRLLQRIRG
jgi:hypothetical protein